MLKKNRKIRNAIQFSVENLPILEHLSLRERNRMEFLCLYIEKKLKDSGSEWINDHSKSLKTEVDQNSIRRYKTIKMTSMKGRCASERKHFGIK